MLKKHELPSYFLATLTYTPWISNLKLPISNYNITKSINWYPFNQKMVSNTNDKKKLGKGTKSVHSGTTPSENS